MGRVKGNSFQTQLVLYTSVPRTLYITEPPLLYTANES